MDIVVTAPEYLHKFGYFLSSFYDYLWKVSKIGT